MVITGLVIAIFVVVVTSATVGDVIARRDGCCYGEHLLVGHWLLLRGFGHWCRFGFTGVYVNTSTVVGNFVIYYYVTR